MMKMMAAAVCLVALVGCGGPLEDESTAPTTGSAKQEVLNLEGLPSPSDKGGLVVNTALLQNPQERVIRAPAFQDQQHLTNPFHDGCR